MPPSKRALSESSGNAQPTLDETDRSKAAKSDENNENNAINGTEEGESELPADHISKRPPYTYICLSKPHRFLDGFDGSDSEASDDEDAHSEPSEQKGDDMWNKLASDHPEWPHVIMAESWRKLADVIRLATYTDPDNFDMYVHNDFHSYGILEIVENLLIEFDKVQRGTSNSPPNVDQMWCLVTTLGHWLNRSDGSYFFNCDDGERVGMVFELLGTALLTVLEHIDRAAGLKEDSKYRDLGFVMALWYKLSVFPAEIPVDASYEDSLSWRPHVMAYAKKAGINLSEQHVSGIDQTLEQFEDVPAIEAASNSGDRWDWQKKMKAYKRGYKMGGDQHNILLWSRKARKDASMDSPKKDPLAEFSPETLKSGKLMLG